MKVSPSVVLRDIKTFFSMSGAILRGKYKMPWGTLAVAVLCLVYIVSPVDFIPDVVPILGITDDGTFILLVLAMLHKNLAAYRQSLIKKENAPEAKITARPDTPTDPEKSAPPPNYGENLKK